MKKLLTTLIIAGLCHSAAAAGIHTHDAWARATVEGMKMGGAFVVVHNEKNTADTLTGAASPVAERVEIHTHINDNGVMRMRQAKDGVALPPKASVALKPGGYHIMFMGLKKPLTAGDKFPVTLKFKHDKPQTVTFEVKNAPAPAEQHHHHGEAHQH
ncbi:copper chaperone PCu(A)C [Neisseria sp. ZJ106]|uniref:Copper chaperone PCu(A)C n=1 Tax=Neisseria lisongii TaxID=2912188 RepID=A0AAW5AK50_9NEIS|nr:copper chaperone PCu(A)C [Neisseria lisongii]MCF7521366.1 copper chaperone PCu(A)C [Neisseria lisongii]MCF7530233.1 copper chaperone PCu(A)C [Neisseria lisongii]WCL71891.1 copper chaperone PCu(A)C [Neisseria lisongii]